MNGHVVATIEDDRGAMGAIQLGHGVAAFDPSGVARHGNDVVDDDVLGQQVEELLAVYQSGYTSFDDPEERARAWKSSRLLTAVIGIRPRPSWWLCGGRSRRSWSAPRLWPSPRRRWAVSRGQCRWFRSAYGEPPRIRPPGEPGVAVKVKVRDRLASDLADSRGRVGEGECLGTGERVLGTSMGIRIGQAEPRSFYACVGVPGALFGCPRSARVRSNAVLAGPPELDDCLIR